MNPLPKALVQLAADRAVVLGEILTRLTRQKLASKSAENLVRATRETVERLHTRCRDLLSTPDASVSAQPAMETEGRLLNTFLEFLENHLVPLLERCNIIHTPPEIVAPIIRVAHKLYPDSDILVVSVRESNYRFALIGKLLYDNFRQIACNDLLASHSVTESLRLLQFCAIPPNGILNHSLISHELAHGLYQDGGLAAQILPSVQIDEDRIKRLVELRASSQVGDISVPHGGPPRQRRLDEFFDRSVIEFNIKTHIGLTIKAWIEEFACDVMGICLFGPAFLFSQLYFMIPVEKLDDAHATHPSLRMRLQYCFNSLLGTEEGLGYRKLSSVSMETYLSSWRKILFDKIPKVEEEELQIAYDSIRPVLSLIRRICKRKVRTFSMTVKRYDDIVPQLCARLSQVLPPNEYCDTEVGKIVKAEFVSILNAGWVFHLGLIVPTPNFLDTLSPESMRKKVLLLIQGAVEISELDNSWVKESTNVSPQ